MEDTENYPFVVNEIVRDSYEKFVSEVQKQMPVKIMGSVWMFRLENGKCLIANLDNLKP